MALCRQHKTASYHEENEGIIGIAEWLGGLGARLRQGVGVHLRRQFLGSGKKFRIGYQTMDLLGIEGNTIIKGVFAFHGSIVKSAAI